MMKIADKRKGGQKLGRAGISEKIIELAIDIVENRSYKNAIIKAGEIAVLVEASTFDEYWHEKSNHGRYSQEEKLSRLINT